jgi:hypothetical protein
MIPMPVKFELHEVVHVCIPEVLGKPGSILEGWVGEVSTRTQFNVVIDSRFRPSSIPEEIVIHKNTPTGLLESDARAKTLSSEKRLIIAVELTGLFRDVQRRDTCRVGVRSGTHYWKRATGDIGWKVAVPQDISIGGASILLHGEQLEVGDELLIDLEVNGVRFVIPAVACRVGYRPDGSPGCCSMQFMHVDAQQQQSLAKAITKLQLKIISSRLRVK